MARLRKKERILHPTFRHFQNIILICLLLVAISMYFYGPRPLVLIIISSFVAIVSDYVLMWGRERVYDVTDLSSIAFAIIFTLMLPASAPYYVAILGTLVTVILGKHAFGGSGNYPFHPSAFGFGASAICWPDIIFKYPEPFSDIPLGFVADTQLFNSPAATLKIGGVPQIDLIDLMIGNYNGPIGSACFLILFAALILLIANNTITWHIPISCLSVVVVWSFLFPRIQVSRFESVLFEVLTDSLIFTCIFIATEPSASPSNTKSKIIYGLSFGVATCVFAYFGAIEFGASFAVMAISPISSWLDRRYSLTRNLRSRYGGND